MELSAKIIDVSTGDSPVVLMTRNTAAKHDLHIADRVVLECAGKTVIASVNSTASVIKDDQIGLFTETAFAIGAIEGRSIKITPAPKPECIKFIKKKMEGKELSDEEILTIVKDIVDRKITQIELTYFVAACSMFPLSFREIATLTKSMADTGIKLHFDKKMVIDKHCIGGVPNNRTSMITIPIMASLGYTVPKTSSRAITSPAGTADTMEVLTNVELPADKMTEVVKKVGACLVWGGSVNLAPADDRIIRVERPLSIDAVSLMLASVMAKKYSVGSTHVLIDIPYGPGAKVETLEKAQSLKSQFETIGKLLGMHMLVIVTDGSQPVGNGVGPLLEAYDVFAVLKNDPGAPQDLREKSIMIAGKLLEFIGHCKKGNGERIAEEEIVSGRALTKFNQIIDAQGRKTLPPLGKFKADVTAPRSGMVKAIDNLGVAKIARIAGAPFSQNAGVLLYAKVGHKLEKDDPLLTVYADNEEKLKAAIAYTCDIAIPYTIVEK